MGKLVVFLMALECRGIQYTHQQLQQYQVPQKSFLGLL